MAETYWEYQEFRYLCLGAIDNIIHVEATVGATDSAEYWEDISMSKKPAVRTALRIFVRIIIRATLNSRIIKNKNFCAMCRKPTSCQC